MMTDEVGLKEKPEDKINDIQRHTTNTTPQDDTRTLLECQA